MFYTEKQKGKPLDEAMAERTKSACQHGLLFKSIGNKVICTVFTVSFEASVSYL